MPQKTAAALALSALFAGAAGAAQPGQSGDLRNVVIEGVTRIQMRGDKPFAVPEPDHRAAVEKHMGDYMAEVDPTENLSASFPLYLPSKTASDLVRSPWRGGLTEPPVLVLSVKSPPSVKVAHWRLLISDDLGKVFRTIKGKGAVPGVIRWDGLSDGGDPMMVGRPYAYSLSAIDESEVPTYLFGKSLVVNALVHRTAGRVSVYINPELAFTKGPELTSQGRVYLRETQDMLQKIVQDYTVSVSVARSDQDLSQREAELVKARLEEALHLPKGSVSARAAVPARRHYQELEIRAEKRK